MKNQIKRIGSTKSGALKWFQEMSTLPFQIKALFADSSIEMIIRKAGNKRTLAQNAYLWGVMYDNLLNYFRTENPALKVSSEDVHNLCKEKFLPIVFQGVLKDAKDKFGNIHSIPYTTTRLTTVQFSEYKDLIQYWAAEHLGCKIPDPNENYKKEVNKQRAKIINIDKEPFIDF